jgi:uncharacterized membrane protein YbjE (DUF340 family)
LHHQFGHGLSEEEVLSSNLTSSDVFKKLSESVKILKTDGFSFIETRLYDAHVRIQVEPKDQGSELKISCDFKRYWITLTVVTLLLIPIFLMVDWVMFRRLDPDSVTISLIFLIGWHMMKSSDEKKKKEKIIKKVMKIIQQ